MLGLLNLKKRWSKHLSDNSMSYGSHFMFAVGHGIRCIKAGILLVIHGFLPCFYRKAGSKLVYRLSKEFTEHTYKKYISKHAEELENTK